MTQCSSVPYAATIPDPENVHGIVPVGYLSPWHNAGFALFVIKTLPTKTVINAILCIKIVYNLAICNMLTNVN